MDNLKMFVGIVVFLIAFAYMAFAMAEYYKTREKK